jgi:protein-L-isoaspartate O-methyltransferase
MSKLPIKTVERIFPEHFVQTKHTYLLSLKLLFAYEFVKQIVPKNSIVLEVGCGPGYGTHCLLNHVKHITGLA